MKKKTETDKSLCNCRNKNLCRLKSKGYTKNVIYKAIVTTKNEIKQYIVSTGGPLIQDGMAMLKTLKYIKKTATTCKITPGSLKTIIMTIK